MAKINFLACHQITLAIIAAFLAILFSQQSWCQTAGTFAEKNLSDSPKPHLSSTDKKQESPTNKNDNQQNDAIQTLSKVGSIADLLTNSKTMSIMFDEEQSSNINRAIDALKNNQVYVPDEDQDNASANAEERKKKEAEEKAAEKKKKIEEESEKSYIYLASLMFFAPDNWVVWINNQKISSQTNDAQKELYIKEIYKDRIKILWTLSISKWRVLSGRKSEEFAPKINENNQVEVEFELKPNQTFILSANTVVEGQAVVNLIKKKEEEKRVKAESTDKPGIASWFLDAIKK